MEERRREDVFLGHVCEQYPEGAHVVEVGIGKRDETARRLAEEGFDVTATDVRDLGAYDDVEFVRDDVTSPDLSVYEGASLVYSVRPPYEIHSEIDAVARSVGADTLLAPLADEGTPLESDDDFGLINRDGHAFFVRRS